MALHGPRVSCIVRDEEEPRPTLLQGLDAAMAGTPRVRGIAPAYVGAEWSEVPDGVRPVITDGLQSPAPLVVIWGETRVGKTRSLWAARRHAASVGDRRSWLIATTEALLESRGSLNQELWRRAHTVDILCVDDLLQGLTTWTDVQQQRLTSLLTDRHGHPTICTDNRNPLTIDWSAFGPDYVRLAGRLAEAATIEHPAVDY